MMLCYVSCVMWVVFWKHIPLGVKALSLSSIVFRDLGRFLFSLFGGIWCLSLEFKIYLLPIPKEKKSALLGGWHRLPHRRVAKHPDSCLQLQLMTLPPSSTITETRILRKVGFSAQQIWKLFGLSSHFWGESGNFIS